jgi:ATP-dependent DNA helicase RecG
LKKISDPIPEKILERYNLPNLKNSFFYLHLPKEEKNYEVAKKRFAFEEIFLIQLIKGIEREKYQKSGAFIINPEKDKIDKFINSFEFDFTPGQKEVVESILKDFKKGVPMSRLLEGDVGSGKTVVAACATFFASETKPKNQSFGKLQVAYMAPTEILAKQIFSEFIKIFSPYGKKIALLTSKDVQVFPSKVSPGETAKISKKKLNEWILNGEIQIVVGTHALISKNVFFENLGLVIIDEQHRFGKKQRAALRQKPDSKVLAKKEGQIKTSDKIIKKGLAENEDILPHLLSMTATPIPRTLALSLYGDLDLSLMTDMPKGRKRVETEIYIDNETERERVYSEVKIQLDEGRQMYVICPRIDDPDPEKTTALNIKSAVSTKINLENNKFFKGFKIGLLHSKLKKEEKDGVMSDFLENKYQILVSTSVIEVGVSVANATVMIIEGGERFGLSQLHQFRGRVQRSSYQSYCYIFANTKNEKTLQRLDAIKKAKNGFELAELDLNFRGAGEILGNKQSGISDLAMEAIRNLKMVEFARIEAQKMAKDQLYKKHKVLNEKLKNIRDKVYME